MGTLTLTFLVPPFSYANDNDSLYVSKTANRYTWSACAKNQGSSKCDFRGYSFGGTECSLSPLIPGRREYCMFPNFLSTYDPRWQNLAGTSEYQQYEHSPLEFGQCVQRNTRGGNPANRELLYLYTNIIYDANAVANAALANNLILVDLQEIYLRPKEACTEFKPFLAKTDANIRAYNIIFRKVCINSIQSSLLCEYNAIGEKPTECALIDQTSTPPRDACRWWWELASTPTTTICDSEAMLSPTCFAECSKPTKNCDAAISNYCAGLTPEQGTTRFARLCGCFQPSSVTLPYYQQANTISPGLIDVTRKSDECFFPACAPLTTLKPFATKNAGNIKCPDQVLCIQPVNITLGEGSSANDIIVKNSCPGITPSLVKCEKNWVPTTSVDGNYIKCCPQGSQLKENGTCNINESTKNVVLIIFSGLFIFMFFVALLSEKVT